MKRTMDSTERCKTFRNIWKTMKRVVCFSSKMQQERPEDGQNVKMLISAGKRPTPSVEGTKRKTNDLEKGVTSWWPNSRRNLAGIFERVCSGSARVSNVRRQHRSVVLRSWIWPDDCLKVIHHQAAPTRWKTSHLFGNPGRTTCDQMWKGP